MEIQGQDFGIEIEMTGLTRSRAAEVIAEYFGTTKEYEGSFYDTYFARDTAVWTAGGRRGAERPAPIGTTAWRWSAPSASMGISKRCRS